MVGQVFNAMTVPVVGHQKRWEGGCIIMNYVELEEICQKSTKFLSSPDSQEFDFRAFCRTWRLKREWNSVHQAVKFLADTG